MSGMVETRGDMHTVYIMCGNVCAAEKQVKTLLCMETCDVVMSILKMG